jgi:deazaflavin-dependent oxidoreductase (nitroreductase family)
VSLWKTTLPVAVYRMTRGRVLGRIGGQPVLLLQTTGCRSGKPRTTPVQYLPDGEQLVVVAANAGAARSPAWLWNLRADPRARVQLRSETLDVIAREASGNEHAVLWGRLTAANGSLDKVAHRAGRPLPIVVLEAAPRADHGERETAMPRGLTEQARTDWVALARPTVAPARFDPDATAGLPEPVRRWLRHAIAAGTPLQAGVELRMHGQIRLGAWRPFTAVQRVTPSGGFVWAATARLLGLPVTGFDRFTRGTGQMRWRLLGAVPVMAAEGEDITRSAAGRHAGELLLAAPAAALDPGLRWSEVDAEHATARLRVGPDEHEVTLTVAADGALTELHMSRWGNPGNTPFASHAFGATLNDEATFGGVTIPRSITAGWHHGTDRWPEGQFIRYTIDHAHFSCAPSCC